MSEILKEVTEWNHSIQPNHTYLISDSGAIIAYAVFSGDEIRISKSGSIKIDKRYRKFVKSNHPGLVKLLKKEKPESDVRKFKVKSKEKEYIVSLKENSYSCTCTGFTFRGHCKHINAVAEKLQPA